MNGALQQLRRSVVRLVPFRFHPYGRALRSFVGYSGGRVMAGPFAGQLSVVDQRDHVDPEMLLGIYELELHGTIEQIIAADFDTFVDIGSAQGYYVIGIARRCPRMRIIAFESSPTPAEQLARAAEANRVRDRIELLGNCDRDSLARALQDASRACLLVDVEGYEGELLDPETIPALQTVSLLIEEHSFILPGVKDLLRSRFAATHEISEVPSRPRVESDLPPSLGTRWHLMNVNQRPASQSWLWMTPKATTGGDFV